MANVALRKPVLEPEVSQPAAATDGRTTGYTKTSGYASFRWPGSLTVDLGRDFLPRCIRVLLWNEQGAGEPTSSARRYRYAMLTRADSESFWSLLYTTTGVGHSGWQVFWINEPFPVRYVRIDGQHNTANAHFHVVQVEVYEGEPPPLPEPGANLEMVATAQRVTRGAVPTVESAGGEPGGTWPDLPPGSRLLPRGDRPLAPGTTLDSYRLIARLGQGYSATVWKAEVTSVPPGVGLSRGDVVAIKVYRPELLAGLESIRIQREFTIASQLDHPSLGKVYDVVISPSRPWHTFLVMEYVEGQTLKEHVEATGHLGAGEVAEIGRQLLEGADALHSQQALHRDIKAANVILTDPGKTLVKLLDFGIVGLATDAALTASTAFLGSKHSAPYEQLTGKPLDERADIYAIGSVMYHCYEGRAPYSGAGPEGAIVEQMIQAPARAVARASEDGPLVEFINRCLAVQSTARPRTAVIALEELQRLR